MGSPKLDASKGVAWMNFDGNLACVDLISYISLENVNNGTKMELKYYIVCKKGVEYTKCAMMNAEKSAKKRVLNIK